MIKRSLGYFWSVRKEFAKYFIIGFSGVFLDLGSLILLKEKFGFHPVPAIVVNQAFLMAYNFSLNKYWAFRNREMPHWQIARYLILGAFNYAFSIGAMYLLFQRYGVDYRLARIVTIAVMVAWNFFLYKYWVYRVTLPPDHLNTLQPNNAVQSSDKVVK